MAESNDSVPTPLGAADRAGAPSAIHPFAPPAEATGGPSRAPRPLIPIFIIVFIDVMGLTLIIPLLPFYALKFGATPFQATLLLSVFAVFQLFSGPFLGGWSDRSGRKIVLLVSQAGMLASYVVLGFANALWVVFVGRIIAGITSGNLSVAQAYISDVTKPEERTKAFGFFGIAFGLGFVLGPALAFGLTTLGSESTPFFGSAVLSGLSFACTLVMLPDARPTVSSGRSAPAWALLARREPRRRLLEFFLFNLSFSTFIGGFALYLNAQFNFDQTHASLMFLYTGLLGAFIQGGLIGRLAKQIGEKKLALSGFVAMAVGHFFLGWIHWVPALMAVAVVGSYGTAVTRPALTTLITKSVGPNEQGKALGLGTTLASVSQIVGPPAAGWLIQNRFLGAYGALVGVLSAIGVVLLAFPGADPKPDASGARLGSPGE